MRKLMWFTLGFAAACALCAYLWLTKYVWIIAIIAAELFMISATLSIRVKWLRYPAAVFLGCATGFLWFQLFSANYLSLAADLDGKIADTTAYCTDYSYETKYGTAVEGVLWLEGKPARAKFYVNGKIDMEPGDVLKGAFEFRVTTPDGTDEPTAHQGKGIFLLAYQEEDAELLKLETPPKWTFAARLKRNLLNVLDTYFPEDAAPFAKALLLGERTGIDNRSGTAFQFAAGNLSRSLLRIFYSYISTVQCTAGNGERTVIPNGKSAFKLAAGNDRGAIILYGLRFRLV